MDMKIYPRYVTRDFAPFDPVELARETERIVCRGDERKYEEFYATGVYALGECRPHATHMVA